MTPTKPSRIRRHRAWVLWLTLAAAAPAWALLESAHASDAPSPSETIRSLVSALAFWTVTPVALIGTLVAARRTWRDARHRAGRFTRRERHELERRDAARRADAFWWQGARQLAAHLVARQVPPTIDVWDVVRSSPDEHFFHDGPAGYARYYGTNVQYTTHGFVGVGPAAFVAAGLAVTALGNAAARSAAQREAMERWREAAPCRVVVSNRRIVVQVHGRWLSFYYSGMTAVHPHVGQWSLVCQFSDCEPLMLSGPGALAAAVLSVYQTHGADGLARHPGLAELRG